MNTENTPAGTQEAGLSEAAGSAKWPAYDDLEGPEANATNYLRYLDETSNEETTPADIAVKINDRFRLALTAEQVTSALLPNGNLVILEINNL